MHDPLQLSEQPDAVDVRITRSALHPEFQRLYDRITSPHYPDSIDVRVQLLAHLIYVAYRDLKETIAQ